MSIRWAEYRWSLWKLRRSESKLRSDHEKTIAKARAEGQPSVRIDELHHDHFIDWLEVSDELSRLNSRYLMAEANLLFLDPKLVDGDWEKSHTGSKYLTLAAMAKVNEIIRKEHADRRQHWLPLVTSIGAIVAALTGLITVLFKK